MLLIRLYEMVLSSMEEKVVDLIHSQTPGLLDKVMQNKDFVVVPSFRMGKTNTGLEGKCETNTHNFIYDYVTKTGVMDRMYPVGGFQVTPGGHLVEHWWIYDEQTKKHFETCPFDPNKLAGYIGIINRDINEEISKNPYVFDVDFFKGGNPYSWYFK